MWESDFGKEESWYVIGCRDDTQEPAYVILGFKEGISRKKFEELYRQEDMQGLENLCHKIPVQTGDVFFVGGGLVHALGEGCFVIEVQEPSDITVVPITNEKRSKAHNRETLEDNDTYEQRMLGSFIYDGCSYEENLRRWRIPNKTIREGAWGKEYVLVGTDQTAYFSFTRIDVKGDTEIVSTGFPRVAMVLEGTGQFIFEGGTMKLQKGDEIFLPWSIPGLRLTGENSVVLCNPEGVSL
jgi:mannose-6-phosphate isomerase